MKNSRPEIDHFWTRQFTSGPGGGWWWLAAGVVMRRQQIILKLFTKNTHQKIFLKILFIRFILATLHLLLSTHYTDSSA